jgi:NTP pyrophosphatase (non-canonical NTP hydrolase)
MSNLEDLQNEANEVALKYTAYNERKGQKAWGPKDRAMGFAIDVGELMELVMAKEGMRHIDDVDTKLAHELSDCLWSILVLADQYDINLSAEFARTMDELRKRTAR